MSENTPEETPAGATEDKPTEKEQAAKSETDWKAEARKWEQRAKENLSAKEKLTALEEASKTEAQKAADRAEQAEQRAQKAEAEALRFRIANEYKLSQEDAMALEHVASEEGMRTVADRLRASAESNRPKPPKSPSLKSGSSSAEPTGEKGRAAAALRSLRQG
jgi:predicted DNA binding CopG/RHH family protein